MPQQSDLLAVLVDADNVSPSRIGGVLAEIATYGTASVKRIYGDWTKSQLRGWKDAASEHVIQPMQQFDNTTGKNATDSALIIDAMDLLYTRRFQGFCIVSSDSDFTRLASRIREEGVTVYGFGERKTPEAFRNACDQFTYLEVLGVVDEPDAARSTASGRWTPAALRADARLVALLRSAVETASADDGWSDLGTVGQLMRKQQPDFDPRNWGYAKLSDLLKAVGLFTIESKPGGMSIRPKAAKGSKTPDESSRLQVEGDSAGGSGRARRKPARAQSGSSGSSSDAEPAAPDVDATSQDAAPQDGAAGEPPSTQRAADAGTSGDPRGVDTRSSAPDGRGRRPMIEQLTLGAALDAALDAVSSAARGAAGTAAPVSAPAEDEARGARAVVEPADTRDADPREAAVEAPDSGRGTEKPAGTKKPAAAKKTSGAKTRASRAAGAADGGARTEASAGAVDPAAGAAASDAAAAPTDAPEGAVAGRTAARTRKKAAAAPTVEAGVETGAEGATEAGTESAGGTAPKAAERPKRAPRSRAAKSAAVVQPEATEASEGAKNTAGEAEPAPASVDADAGAAEATPAEPAPAERPKRAPRRASRPASNAG